MNFEQQKVLKRLTFLRDSRLNDLMEWNCPKSFCEICRSTLSDWADSDTGYYQSPISDQSETNSQIMAENRKWWSLCWQQSIVHWPLSGADLVLRDHMNKQKTNSVCVIQAKIDHHRSPDSRQWKCKNLKSRFRWESIGIAIRTAASDLVRATAGIKLKVLLFDKVRSEWQSEQCLYHV